MDLFSQVRQYIEDNALFNPEERVVLGCSGGSDSVALLLILREMGCQVTVVHVNHGLRESADADAVFVRALAERLQCAFRAERIDAKISPAYIIGDTFPAAEEAASCNLREANRTVRSTTISAILG